MPIFRGQVSVQIQKEIIDEKNISEIYKNNYCKSENEKKMCVEFFDFVKKIDANNYIEYQIGITPGDTRNISKNSNDEKIRSDYNKGEILKFKIPVEIKKYKIVDDRKTNEVELINSFFNIYAKKFSEKFIFCANSFFP